jgi:hypothetical protein
VANQEENFHDFRAAEWAEEGQKFSVCRLPSRVDFLFLALADVASAICACLDFVGFVTTYVVLLIK